MKNNLTAALLLTTLTLFQGACIFGARTPIGTNHNDNNQTNNQTNNQNNQCDALPVCPSNFTESPACTRDGRECKQVTTCGTTITCVADDSCLFSPEAPDAPSCPPAYIEVDSCPPNSDCKRIDGECGAVTFCLRDAPCPDGAAFACPDDYVPVERCDEDLESCMATTICGQTLYCYYDGPMCESIAPQCPEGSRHVPSCDGADADPDQCPECADGSCSTERFCDITLTCKKSDCDPLDAKGQGLCQLPLGITWNGQSCELISGCECVGSDCDNLYFDEASCERSNLFCEDTMISCQARNNAYFPQEVAVIGGYAWDGRQCVGLLGQGPCQGPDCPYVYDTLAQCQQTFGHCQNNTTCLAQDARGVGLCDADFGAAFNGNSCYTISGCDCRGADCDKLYMDVESCKNATLQCAP